MATIGRLAGALLVETGEQWWLVGNTKEPCDWAAHGFEPPPQIDATKRPYLRLRRVGRPNIGEPHLVVDREGESLAREAAKRLLVERNGSVSERLWRLVLGIDDAGEAPRGGVASGWLFETPAPIWQIVRDSVLRCL
jgi:hypothetical protein